MKEKIRGTLKNVYNKLQLSVKRFPEAIGVTVVLVVLGIIINHSNDYDLNETLGRVMLAVHLALPSTVILALLNERVSIKKSIRLIIDLILIIILSIFYFTLPSELHVQFITRYITVSIILYVIFTLVPYVYNRKNYSIYVIKLILSFLTTYLYILVLYGGLSAIIFTIDQLFNLNVQGEIYFDLFMIAVGIFGVTFFLGNLPKYETNLTIEHYSKIVKVLVVSIVMPLLSVYTVVLYAYFAKILITTEWPIGIVGHLVLWYGFISIIVLFAINKLDKDNQWVVKFKKYYPIVFIIPLVMMFIAISIRINAYGFTLLRYYVVISGVWFAVVMSLYITRRKQKTILTILTLLVFMLISIYGPLNGFSVSFRSQNNRLEDRLKELEMLEGNKIVKRTDLSSSQEESINNILRYFDSMDALDEIDILPNDFTLEDTKDEFGFEYSYYYDRFEKENYFSYYYHQQPEKAELQNISNFDYYVDLTLYDRFNFNVSNDQISINVSKDYELEIKYNESVIKKSLLEVARELNENLGNKHEVEKDDLTYTIDTDYISIKIDLVELHGLINGDKVEIHNMSGKLWINIK